MIDVATGYLPTAFLLGALHSFEPAHGKAVLVAYLAGGRHRLIDAILFGLIITVAHTFSIMALGLGAWLAAQYFGLSHTGPIVTLAGGILVLIVGFWMLIRWRRGACDHPGHGHHEHHPEKASDGRNGTGGQRSFGQLAMLGLGGGLVPCPAGVAMLMTSVAAGNLANGLGLATAFSLGTGFVVLVLSVIIQRASLSMSRWFAEDSTFVAYLPLISSLVVIGIGMWLGASAFLDVVEGNGY